MQAATGKVGDVQAQELEREWTLQLLVSLDRLSAYLRVELNGEDKDCPPERVLDFVKKCGLSLSVEENAALGAAVEAVRKGSKQPVRIAEGRAPKAATHTIKWFVSMERARDSAAGSRASIDPRAVSHFVTATAGQNLCQIIDTPAVEGRDVFGEPIPVPPPPKEGDARPAPTLKLGKGVELAADGMTAIAQLDGSVELTDGVLSVTKVLPVKGNVDFKIGNIDFNGDVNVAGDVLPGFAVRATGDVRVGGVIERASVTAGGHLVVRGGVAGRHSATIKAGRNVEARYLHMIAVDAGESVVIHSECLESHVAAGRDVVVEQGAIIGGTVRARGNVRAAVVGSELGVPTIITAGRDNGADAELLLARRGLANLLAAVKNDQLAIAHLIGPGGRANLPPSKQKMLEVLERQLATREAEVEPQRAAVATAIAHYLERAGTVEIKKRIYANVTIRIGEYSRMMNVDQDGPLTFYPDVDNGTLAWKGKGDGGGQGK